MAGQDEHDGAAWPDDVTRAGAVRDSATLVDAPGEAFILRLKSYEGPLDLLLDLARRQKVDLAEISVTELAEQYIAVINRARRLKLELAAAWRKHRIRRKWR